MPRVFPPLETKQQNHHLAPSLVEVAAGFSAGTISTLAVHPFDVIKTRLQVDLDSRTQLGGSARVVQNILREDGLLRGFYRGLGPNIVGNSISWAIYFMWYGNIKDLFKAYRRGGQLQSFDYFLASGASGIMTNIVTNPIWVIKTRMLSTSRNHPGAYKSIMHGAKEIHRNEGLRGFYRGLVPSMFGVSHGAIQFMAYEKLKIWRAKQIAEKDNEEKHSQTVFTTDVKGTVSSMGAKVGANFKNTEQPPVGEAKQTETRVELNNWDFLFLSAMSKIFAGTITYPYQVLRARLQTYDAHLRYRGALDLMGQIWRAEGLVGFYKGLGPNVIRVLPSTCVTFIVYENTKRYLPSFFDDASEENGGADTQNTGNAKSRAS